MAVIETIYFIVPQGVFIAILPVLLIILYNLINRRKIRERELNNFKKGLYNELVEIKLILTSLTLLLLDKVGGINREILLWCHKIQTEHKDKLLDKEELTATEKALEYTDEELKKAGFLKSTSNKKALHLKRTETPFLNSKIGNLPLLDEDLQSKITKIQAWIKSLNENVAQSNSEVGKTFESGLSRENYKIIINDIQKGYHFMAILTRLIVDLISDIEKELKPAK